MTKILDKKALKEQLARHVDLSKSQMTGSMGGRRGGGPGRMAMGAKPKHAKETVKRLLGYLKNYRIAIAFVTILLVAATGLNLLIPTLFSIALDDYIIPRAYTGVYLIGIYVIGIALINGFVRFLSRFVMVRISQKIVKKIREQAFSKLMKAPISYTDKQGSGDIVSRLSNDVELISASLGQTVLEVINSLIILVGAAFLMVRLNWRLSLVVFAFIPLLAIFTVFIGKKTRKGFKEQQLHLAALNGLIEENITGLKVVKLYNQEPVFTEEFRQENDQLKKAGFMAQFYSGIIWPFVLFVNNFIYLAVIAVGAILYVTLGPLAVTIGQIAGVSQYSRQFIMPINNLAQLFNALMQGIAGAERVFELIDTDSEYDHDGTAVIDRFEGNIEFDDVSFGYSDDIQVLKNISFKAKQGEVIAIVGPTGGGKTTTIKLLNRFYDVNQGTIKIDNIDIKDIQIDELRKRVGVVLQDTHLFKGTVFENIHYGDFTAAYDTVIDASKMANAHDFISKLPKGYDTEVSEGGQNFSQGERQLISIARTFLNNPDLLILDEATSNIDTRTEAKIQASMEKLIQKRTSIVIAHRLQTIQKADTILVIHEGKLIESGNHQSLLEQKGFYHQLYYAQFAQ